MTETKRTTRPGRDRTGTTDQAGTGAAGTLRPLPQRLPWPWAFRLPAGLLCLLMLWLLVFGQYFLRQGLAMAGLWLSAREVDSSLLDPGLDPSDRLFLQKVEGIRQFAIRELGLNGDRNYRTWIKHDQSWVIMAVSACADDRFEQYLWHYPFLGPLPYHGFFAEADGRAEFDRLKALGLDVMMRGVGAFSTLGILPDPLLSSWKEYSDQDLADLIIHELTHATLFVPGQGDFNENLASFVGHEGARQYMERLHTRGDGQAGDTAHAAGSSDAAARSALSGSPAPAGASGPGTDRSQAVPALAPGASVSSVADPEADRRKDDDAWTRLLHGLYLDLDRIYRDTGLSRDQKLAIKKWTYDRFSANLDRNYPSFFRTPDYRKAVTQRLNNAVIMLYRTYDARRDDFSQSFGEQGSNIKAYLAWIKDHLTRGEKVPGMAD